MPYPDGSFDRVFSSFMFHHLERNAKEGTLREVRRVLKSGGFLYLLDFAGHGSRSNGVFARLLHSSHRLEDNSEDRILALMADAGFTDPKNIRQGGMFFGHLRINYYEASAR
jgi:ubiquinone/menaquinone biosynthesis C-methylase UbiE